MERINIYMTFISTKNINKINGTIGNIFSCTISPACQTGFNKVFRGRSHYRQRTCINYATFAYCKAILAQENQIAANFTVLNCIDSTIDIDSIVNNVNQIINPLGSIFFFEIHVGDFASIYIKFIKSI